MELLHLNFSRSHYSLSLGFCLFRLNQVEMGQSYLSTADQPARSANVLLQFKGQEDSAVQECIYCKLLSRDLEREKHML